MKVLVSGSTGLIGSAVSQVLSAEGHDVISLTRSQPKPGQAAVTWDPETGHLDPAELAGVEGVVHLAGESIAEGRWTAAKKARIRDSRVNGTRLLSESLARLDPPARVMVSASAVGFYGDRGEEFLTEESSPGSGFLPDVCRGWEEATGPAAEAGIRVVHMRFGVVLSAEGGALAKMLGAFRMGAGGTFGSGRQYMSWIALEDAVGAIRHALVTETLEGPVNAVAPNPVTNREFTKILGRVLGRPAVLSVPALAARLAFGEAAEALLLASARVKPQRLVESGYEYHCPDLERALRRTLGK